MEKCIKSLIYMPPHDRSAIFVVDFNWGIMKSHKLGTKFDD